MSQTTILGQSPGGAGDPTPIAVDADGKIILSPTGSPALPAGASTEAKQDGEIALLTTIDGDTSNLATHQTDGTQQTIIRGGAKGATTAATITSTSIDADHQAADVAVTAALPTGSNTIGAVTAPSAAALALDATLTGGTQKSILRGGAKGATAAADVTSTAQGADHQGADVVEQFAPGYEDGVLGRAVTLNVPISTGDYAYSGDPFSGVASGVIAPSEANLLALTASNVSGAGLYFKVYNKGSAPLVAAETATLLHHAYVASGSTAYTVTFPSPGKYGALGLAFIWATTPGATTNTAPGDASTLSVSPEYK